MAKKSKTDLVKLTSTGLNAKGKLTGTFFVKKRNPTQQPDKLAFNKYDPKAVYKNEDEFKKANNDNNETPKPGMHVEFKEKKMPNPKAN